MKPLFYSLIFLLAVNIVNAQDKTVSASIQDETNKFLHYVFIEDTRYNTIAYSDSVGSFTIKIQPDSKLTFQLSGYRDTTISANAIDPDAQIILKSAVKLPVETEPSTIHPVFTRQGLIEIPRTRVNVVGSRYLYDTFSHGFFSADNGGIVYNTAYYYNYDKINGTVLLCTSNRTVFKVSQDQIKSLTLINEQDERLDFEKVKAIDPTHFVQVLAKGARYNVYKLIKTKFAVADFENGALGQISGHDYDEYTDEYFYYVQNVSTGKVEKFLLKKSSIRNVFAKESDKVKAFMSKNSNSVDEQYVRDITNYLNN